MSESVKREIEVAECPGCGAPAKRYWREEVHYHGHAEPTPAHYDHYYEDPTIEYRGKYDENPYMSIEQHEYRKLEDEVGEDEATAEVIRQLKDMIELLEKPGYPRIMSANINPPGEDIFTIPSPNRFHGKFDKSPMARISVTISYPWGG